MMVILMKDKAGLRNIIIFGVILIIFTGIYLIIDKLLNNENDEQVFLKNYEVNEYIPVYVSDEDMAKIYFNDYIYTMYSDIEKAYNLLDENYRNKKFGNVENYRNYIKTLNNLSYKVDSFYIDDRSKNKVYGVYDTNGNIFIFKTNGVMQYSVYLDNDTVEI